MDTSFYIISIERKHLSEHYYKYHICHYYHDIDGDGILLIIKNEPFS